MNILIVVDMQNDFVSGALGTPEARRIVPAAAERVAAGIRRGERIFFTRDTHGATISIPGRGGTCLYPTASGGPRAGRSSSSSGLPAQDRPFWTSPPSAARSWGVCWRRRMKRNSLKR